MDSRTLERLHSTAVSGEIAGVIAVGDSRDEAMEQLEEQPSARLLLVRHGVNNIIHADTDAERGILLGIFGIVGILPGIA